MTQPGLTRCKDQQPTAWFPIERVDLSAFSPPGARSARQGSFYGRTSTASKHGAEGPRSPLRQVEGFCTGRVATAPACL